ncbi:MAG: hypothetical protein LAN64_05170 [Acidobacteriia bacterium]|nr:hypothetical protein [Terriglobia bacterium]
MKRIAIVAIALGMAVLAVPSVMANGDNGPNVAPTTVVLGADNPLIDVPAVQSAVDQGGTVILRGKFDFGVDAGNHIIVPGRPYPDQDVKGKSTVFIYQKDVTIIGETGKHGALLTVVKNGMPPFWIGWDGETYRNPPSGTENVDFGRETFPQDSQGRISYRDTGDEIGYLGSQTRYARAFQNVSATIKNIYFDSPKHYGVKATAGRDVILVGNVFSKVQFGGLVHINNPLGPGTGTSGATHIAAGFLGISLAYAPFVYPAITGKIDAEQNLVDDVGTDPTVNTHSGECFGLGALFTNAAVTIQQNEIRNIGRQMNGLGPDVWASSIVLVDNYTASPLVAQNIVYNSSFIGIWDLAALPPPPPGPPLSPGPKIEGNTVSDCALTGIWSDSSILASIVGPREGGLIDKNSISQDSLLGSGQSCIKADFLSACSITRNSFSGTFSGGLVQLGSSNNCTLLMNKDQRKSIPSGSPTYILDRYSPDSPYSSGNLIKGSSGTAVDNGTNNTISLPPRGGKQ